MAERRNNLLVTNLGLVSRASPVFQIMTIAYTTSFGLPVASDGTLQNTSGVSGGFSGSHGFHFNGDGTIATNTVKNASAFLNSIGLLQNPDGSIVNTTSKGAGAFLNSLGVLVNTDGTLVTSTTKSNAFVNSFGILTNSDGTVVTAV